MANKHHNRLRQENEQYLSRLQAWTVMLVIIAMVIIPLLLPGCKTVQVSEQINWRDSTVINYKDSIRWSYRDSLRIIEHHVMVADSSNLVIQFGQGGGTYNAKTGEATNVSGVQHKESHHEQRDSTDFYRARASDYQHTIDSLSNQMTTLQSNYERLEKNTRSGYDRFCSWWFWITAILLLLKVACWVCEKIPVTAPYAILARKYVPFL